MITFDKSGDAGILFTALSNYKAALENDIPVLKAAGTNFRTLVANFEQTKKRVTEMLEEI